MSRFLAISALMLAVSAEAQTVDFNRDILPVLSDKCFHCHGPDSATREADLRLDVDEAAMQDRGGYAAIVPGNPHVSELVSRITADDPDLQMPPQNSGRKLSDKQRQLLIRWISEGAHWEQHWAFVAPTRPEPPSVHRTQWPRNPIDDFVLRRLEAEGLSPSPEAARETWMRRVTLDLTGLPPTLEELDSFLADDSDEAYEKVVDRLLVSPCYGEHMAVTWLDAARYADTDGYQNDGPRTMYRWRDWVIDAFNANMPFDKFTIEQLAGDLLPDASLSQNIATGFNRNHRYNSEAGLVLEEFLLENAVDRVDTTSTVWMGLTMGCARCHDHKYDPFSQREYYQLISFFDNVSESGRAVKFGNSEPWVVSPTEGQRTKLDTLDEELAAAEAELRLALSGTQSAVFFPRVVAHIAESPMSKSTGPVSGEVKKARDPFSDAVISRGLKHHFRFEDRHGEGLAAETGNPTLESGLTGNAATVDGESVFALGKVGDIACQTRSSIAFWLKPENPDRGVILSRQGTSTTRPGFTVELRDGHLRFFIITRWLAGVGAVESSECLTPGEWVHVTLTNDGSQSARGMLIWLNGQRAEANILYNTNSNTGGTGKTSVLRLGGGVHGEKFAGQLDELRFYDRTLFDDEIAVLAEPASIAEIVATDPDQRSQSMMNKLTTWRLEQGEETPDTLRETFDRIADLRDQRVKLIDSFPTTMVMEERSGKRPTHVRVRGEYNKLGEIVSPDVPEAFPALPDSVPKNRLGVAQWLVSGHHPLTARVTVNRDWQRYFGTGLVKTAEDFGRQGELPSHPDLLDWLAIEFVESGWNVKALQKLIVLSATYRQSSRHNRGRHSPSDQPGTTEALENAGSDAALTSSREPVNDDGSSSLSEFESATPHYAEHVGYIDPENRMLSRGPRIRLPARTLRDQALFVSGLMTPEIGGPSVSPYQPAKLWEEMSNMKYNQSQGKNLYRRGLYTLWKRTVAPPSLAVLDAADRENCVVRHKRTNTPLQALTLLNETTFVEAARHLAERMHREGGKKPIRFAFRLLTSRSPTDQELQMLAEARDSYRADLAGDPNRATALLAVGESPVPEDINKIDLAADALLCNVLMNLDEVVTKE